MLGLIYFFTTDRMLDVEAFKWYPWNIVDTVWLLCMRLLSNLKVPVVNFIEDGSNLYFENFYPLPITIIHLCRVSLWRRLMIPWSCCSVEAKRPPKGQLGLMNGRVTRRRIATSFWYEEHCHFLFLPSRSFLSKTLLICKVEALFREMLHILLKVLFLILHKCEVSMDSYHSLKNY